MCCLLPFSRPFDDPFGRTRASTGSLLQWGKRPLMGLARDGAFEEKLGRKKGCLLIFGIGHDIVEIERIQRLLTKSIGERLRRRILTAAELELPGQVARPAEFLAGRFAAKEAVSKAFGCGIGHVLSFTDMEILPDVNGKPLVVLTPEAWERLALPGAGRVEGSGGYAIHLSITHERQLASAFAVVERVE